MSARHLAILAPASLQSWGDNQTAPDPPAEGLAAGYEYRAATTAARPPESPLSPRVPAPPPLGSGAPQKGCYNPTQTHLSHQPSTAPPQKPLMPTRCSPPEPPLPHRHKWHWPCCSSRLRAEYKCWSLGSNRHQSRPHAPHNESAPNCSHNSGFQTPEKSRHAPPRHPAPR